MMNNPYSTPPRKQISSSHPPRSRNSSCDDYSSLLFTPDPDWDPNNVESTSIDVSRWERGPKYVELLSNVLTPRECRELIDSSELRGYVGAKVNTGFGEISMPDVRNSDRCIVDGPVTTEFLWQRVSASACASKLLKRKITHTRQDWHAVGLNERMRFLRYDPGTYFAPHRDGCYMRRHDDVTPADRVGERSFVTLQLYLNEDFAGGETNLVNERDDSQGHPVVPRTGSVLLFQHDVYHEGAMVRSGRKYAIRTDVMYTNKGPGWDYSKRPFF